MKRTGTISLNIREIHQTSSLDHVTVFRAEIELLQDEQAVQLETLNLDSMSEILNADKVLEVLEHIRQGVIAVVRPRGMGAYILVSDFHIHPIDFSARSFERYTRKYLEKALAELENAEEGQV